MCDQSPFSEMKDSFQSPKLKKPTGNKKRMAVFIS